MPSFLNRIQIYKMLQRELPEGVYPDGGSPNQFYSTSDMYSLAIELEKVYTNMGRVYDNMFPLSVNELIDKWEETYFSEPQDRTLLLEQRIQNLIAKIRSKRGISITSIREIINGILSPLGLDFEIFPLSGQDNGSGDTVNWMFEVSELGQDTILSEVDSLISARKDYGFTPIDENLDYIAAGLTLEEFQSIQAVAYTYIVKIYGNANAETLSLLDIKLTKYEPARSTHLVLNNQEKFVYDDSLNCGEFTKITLRDSFACGRFDYPPSTYNIYDCGGF